MYDQTQYTPVWMIDKGGIYLNDDCYFGMKKISGYAPERWITYTQNKPASFWFGAFDQEALDEESRVGFENFTDPKFLGEFELALDKSYKKTKELSEIYFTDFYEKEKEVLEENPLKVVSFLREVREVTSYIISYYLLTQPQRFYKFDEMLKSHLPNKALELVSTTGRHLTYISKITDAIVSYAHEIRKSGASFEEYISAQPDSFDVLKNIVSSYGFLNWGYFGGDLVDEKYVRKEINDLLKDEKKFDEEMRKCNELQSQISLRNSLLRDSKSESSQLADIMGHSSVMRFDLQTCMLCILKYADNFIRAVKEKHSLTTDEINSYYYDEIIDFIQNGRTKKGDILAERQKGFLTVWSQNGTVNYIAEEAHNQIKDLLEFRANEIKFTHEVKGNVASWPDKNISEVVGRAFVLTSAFDAEEELKKFNEGDILVATQTHPNLVPQMKKASAVVTDEGGITCHAAIVSRELGKPCIIGTKLSSKIFKTGDLIKADLKNATVKKSE